MIKGGKYSTGILRLMPAALVLVIVLPLLSSCGKNNTVAPATLNTQLNIINLSPDILPLDFYIDLRKQNTRSSYIYSVPSGYLSLPSLRNQLQLRTLKNTTIVDTTPTLSANTRYSLFITGLLGDKTISSVFVADSDAAPTIGRGKVRFINLAARPVNVDVTANGTMAFQNQAIKKPSKYLELPAGIYDFKILNAGTTSVLSDLPKTTIQDGRLYTLYTRGIDGRTDTAAFTSVILINR